MSAKNINEFTDLVNGIDDVGVLNVAKGLMDDLLSIAKMREKIKILEEGLSTEERAIFYFFVLGLEDEEVGFCAEAVSGRLRFLKEKEERLNAGKNKSSDDEVGTDEILEAVQTVVNEEFGGGKVVVLSADEA